MAAVWQEAFIVLLIFLTFQVMKCAFTSSDIVGLVVTGDEVSFDQEAYLIKLMAGKR